MGGWGLGTAYMLGVCLGAFLNTILLFHCQASDEKVFSVSLSSSCKMSIT